MIDANEEHELLTAFAECRLDLQINNIEVRVGQRLVLRAERGRLYSTPQKKLLLEFQAAPVPVSFPMDPLGSYEGFIVNATADEDWLISTTLFLITPIAYHKIEMMVDWRSETWEVILQRNNNSNLVGLEYLGLVDKLECLFENGTVRETKSGRNKDALDWLELQTAGVNVQVHQGENTWSYVTVQMGQHYEISRFGSEVSATLNAISLRMGKRTEAFAAHWKSSKSEQLCLSGFHYSRPTHSGNAPMIPLILRDNQGSNFIALAKEYFLKQADSKIMSTLCALWDAELVSRENHRLQIAIAVESLSTYINKLHRKSAQTEANKARKTEEKTFSELKDKALKLLAPLAGKPGHITRLKNVIARTALNDAGPRIQDAGERLGLTFCAEEIQLWRAMRNPAAHGDQREFEPHENDFFACQSMLYRMILAMIGWTGPRNHFGPFDPKPVRKAFTEPITHSFNLNDIDGLRRVEKQDGSN
jgi:hypothetical protein